MSSQQYDRYHGNTNYSAYNNNTYDKHKISETESDTKIVPLSIQHEPNIKYTRRIDYICINSKDRDVTRYPNPSQYCTLLPREFKNIVEITLVGGVIPDANNVQNEPFLLLTVEEFDDIIVSNDAAMANSFAILQMSAPVKEGTFLFVEKKVFENVILRYQTPKASLSKLTISVTDEYGTPFNFGTDSNPPLKALQNMFIFKITTLEKDRDQLNQRNVF